MTIGEKIRSLRKEQKLTQKNLALLAGLAEITVRQYEAGKYIPKLEQLKKMAAALGVSPDDLLNDEPILKIPSITRFGVLEDLLTILGYKVEAYEEDACLWIRDLRDNCTYEITQETLDNLGTSILAYSKFQTQELLSHCQKCKSKE